MQSKWNFIESDLKLQESLANKLGITNLTAQMLINRGIDTFECADAFLNTSLHNFHDPYIMKNMKHAVDRILKAVDSGEKIYIYGDYDVDGITATSLLVIFFKEIGVNVEFYIPDRIEEGYGLNKSAIKKIYENGGRLIITVDCGISAVKEVKDANELGVDVIITDHHQMSGELPAAYAILHPGQVSCPYPFKYLAGVGIAFKLIKSIRRELVATGVPPEKLPNLKKHLDIVSLGTIADIAPLLDENHTIAKFGLKEISKTQKEGLKALKSITGLNGKDITVSDVGYALGPRLNAIGRLGDASIGVNLLTTSDPVKAMQIAEQMSAENSKRQAIQQNILSEAREMISKLDLDNQRAIVLASENWHPGVIGIVASKIAEEYYKPTVLIHLEGDRGKGSARSIPSFHLYEGFKKCKELLVDFGGHKFAAGLTIERNKIDPFSVQFEKIVTENLNDDELIKQIDIDSEVSFSDLNMETITEIHRLSPFGSSNPEPLLCAKGVRLSAEPVYMGKKGAHVRADFEHDDEIIETIAFNSKALFESMVPYKDRYDIAFTPEINRWGNIEKIQLRLKDLRPHKS